MTDSMKHELHVSIGKVQRRLHNVVICTGKFQGLWWSKDYSTNDSISDHLRRHLEQEVNRHARRG